MDTNMKYNTFLLMFLIMAILSGCFGGDVDSSDDYKPVDELNEVYIPVDELNWDEYWGLLAPVEAVTFYFENEYITHEVTTGHPMLVDIFSMIAREQDLIRKYPEEGDIHVVITFARPEDHVEVDHYGNLGVNIDSYDGLRTRLYVDASLWDEINWTLTRIRNFSDEPPHESNRIHVDEVDWTDLVANYDTYLVSWVSISTNEERKTFLGSYNSLENVLEFFAQNQDLLKDPSDIDDWENFDWEKEISVSVDFKRNLHFENAFFFIDLSIAQELWDMIDRDDLDYIWN
jgi:hypothetical protein